MLYFGFYKWRRNFLTNGNAIHMTDVAPTNQEILDTWKNYIYSIVGSAEFSMIKRAGRCSKWPATKFWHPDSDLVVWVTDGAVSVPHVVTLLTAAWKSCWNTNLCVFIWYKCSAQTCYRRRQKYVSRLVCKVSDRLLVFFDALYLSVESVEGAQSLVLLCINTQQVQYMF
jgi:hypothetical protein